MFNDRDYWGLTLFQIASRNSFYNLFDDIKVDMMISRMWEGVSWYECEGDPNDFSMLCELNGKINYLPGEEPNIKKAFKLYKNFTKGMKMGFWFQFHAWRMSPMFFCYKEFFFVAL